MRRIYIKPPNIDKTNRKWLEKGKIVRPENVSLPPLGIAYLAACTLRKGHYCKVLDLSVTRWRPLSIDTDMVGISSMTSQYEAAKIIARDLKHIPNIVLGGPHASIYGDELLKDGFTEVVQGEGDTYNSIDDLPFPAWHLFDLDKYDTYYGRKCLPMITTRGCPYQCIYCFKGVFGDYPKIRTAQNVFDEIVHLKETYGVDAIQFQDDIFTIGPTRTIKLCNLLINNKVDILWRCVGRADQVNYQILKLMKRAGMKAIAFGIESGNQGVVDKIGKKLSLQKVKEAISHCNDLGIVSRGYYMIGLPWDTHDTVKETLRFARKNRPTQLQFSIPVPFPGTKLWEIGKEKGLPLSEPVEWDGSRPPYSFSDDLTPGDIEKYIIRARNINAWRLLIHRLKTTPIMDYPKLFARIIERGFCMVRAWI